MNKKNSGILGGLCCLIAVGGMFSGCSWDDTVFTSLVSDDGNVIKCIGNDMDHADLSYIQLQDGTKCYRSEYKHNMYANNSPCAKYALSFEHDICPKEFHCQIDAKNEAFCFHSTCPNGQHLYTDNSGFTDCEFDSIKNCGNHGLDCELRMPGWYDGECEEGLCKANQCQPGYHLLNGVCEADSNERCGNSYTRCVAPQMCADGECRSGCGSLKMCKTGEGNSCANLNTDLNNCGDCGSVCKPEKVDHSEGVACVLGECQANSCQKGFYLHNGVCEENTETHCGSYSNDCTYVIPGWKQGNCTENGQCEAIECDIGYHLEAQKNSSVMTCQADTQKCCGAKCTACEGSTVCSGGECKNNCDPLKLCTGGGNYCANLQSDMNNCGECGNVCSTASVSGSSSVACVEQHCIATICINGYHLYDGSCELNSITNCGGHGMDCATRMAGWADGNCTNDDKCDATSCQKGYHLEKSNKDDKPNRCIADTNQCCGQGCTKCNDGEVCSDGKCGDNCNSLGMCLVKENIEDENETAICVNFQTDINHCGNCGQICSTSLQSNSTKVSCSNGHCIATSCEKGYYLDSDDNSCKMNDTDNCGWKGNRCDSMTGWDTGTCEDEKCNATSCKSGYHVDSTTSKCVADSKQCCGTDCRQCGEMQVCANGSCASGCGTMLTACDASTCANTQSDMNHCGQCNSVCNTSAVANSTKVTCSQSKCIATSCSTGYHTDGSGGCEIDDVNNCGRHDKACGDNQVCTDAMCKCNTGLANCNGVCVNINGSDTNNCGSCGYQCSSANMGWVDGTCNSGDCVARQCASGYHINSRTKLCEADTNQCCGPDCSTCEDMEVCDAGTCKSGCGSNLVVCKNSANESVCADINTNIHHCGECNYSCENNTSLGESGSVATVSCVNKSCVVDACNAGYYLSDDNKCVANNENNCGFKGNNCANLAGWSRGECKSNKCVASECTSNYHVEEGKCVANSDSHCGKGTVTDCSNFSNGTAHCVEGTCLVFSCNSGYRRSSDNTSCIRVTTCEASQTYCENEDACFDLKTTPAHCGSCNISCDSSTTGCANSVCTCESGKTLDETGTHCVSSQCEKCGGTDCVDFDTDRNNCGSCNNVCSIDSYCFMSQCLCDDSAMTYCNGQCTDVSTDIAHCGDCDTDCGDGDHVICVSGTCSCDNGQIYNNGSCPDE